MLQGGAQLFDLEPGVVAVREWGRLHELVVVPVHCCYELSGKMRLIEREEISTIEIMAKSARRRPLNILPFEMGLVHHPSFHIVWPGVHVQQTYFFPERFGIHRWIWKTKG